MAAVFNGAPGPAEQQFKWFQLPKVGGCKYIVTTATGDLVGVIECDYIVPAAQSVLAEIFKQITDQQTKQIQVAPASALSGIKPS